MDGVLNVLKPPGMTSHDVVAYLRRVFQQKKIGHAGTLDPEAAGVLPVCLGRATRLLEYLSLQDKEYLCHLTLGISTVTQDAWGEVIERKDFSAIERSHIENILPYFTGPIRQKVPLFSAVKVDGVPLYKKARRGETVETKERPAHIESIRLIDFQLPTAVLLVACAKGTYIRTLCHDIGERLGAGGHMSFLLRTRTGIFRLEDSYTLEEIGQLKEKTVQQALVHMLNCPSLVLDGDSLKRLAQGKMVEAPAITEMTGTEVAVVDAQCVLRVMAIVLKTQNGQIILKPKKVFPME